MADSNDMKQDKGTLSRAKEKAFDFEVGQKRLEELEALVRKKKKEVSESRRKTETKLKIIIGAYILADKKRLEHVLHQKDFQAFLSDKDKDFIRAAVKSLVNGPHGADGKPETQAVDAKAPAYLEKMEGTPGASE